MHTVFVKDKPLYFVNAYEAEEWKGRSPSVFIAEKEMSVKDALEELEKTKDHPGFIYLAANPDIAWQVFISYCTLIEAAGGLVINEKGEYLIIYRKKKWDLPKGKLDYDESPEAAALREVKEECGVNKLSIIKPLDKTFHTYQEKNKRYLKKNHWYLMQTTGNGSLKPQIEEDIEIAEWMTVEQIRKVVFSNTYLTIKTLLDYNLNI